MTSDSRRKVTRIRIGFLLDSLWWKVFWTLYFFVGASFVGVCCFGSGITATTISCWYLLVILIRDFLNHSSMYSLMGANTISWLVFILNNSFSMSLRSIPNWCNISSSSSFMLMYVTIQISIASLENSIKSVNSLANATFNISSCSNNCYLVESIVSINKLGPLSSFVILTNLKKRSHLLFFTTSNSFMSSLKNFILFNQQRLICFIGMFEGRHYWVTKKV